MLDKIQQELKAPKGQFNSFGKYAYRNCEDILEAVKPLLAKYNAKLTLSDEIVNIGDRNYVKATARVWGDDWNEFVTAWACEPKEKKGMDPSQITGAASSYARKYALNGLFAIDDTKDADSDAPSKDKPSTPEDSREWLNLTNKNGSTNAKYKELQDLMWSKEMTNTALLEMAKKKYKVSKETEDLILKMQEKLVLENEDNEIDLEELPF